MQSNIDNINDIKQQKTWLYAVIVFILHIIAGITVYSVAYSNLITIANSVLRQKILTIVLFLIIVNLIVIIVILFQYFNKIKKFKIIINSLRQENTHYRNAIIESQQLILEEKNKSELLNQDISNKNKLIETYESKIQIDNQELEKATQQLIENQQIISTAKTRAEIGDRLKSAFIACINHEIRTPIHIINNFATLLCKSTLTEEQRIDFTEQMLSSSKRFIDVLDDIILYSNIQAGNIDFTPKTFNLNLLLNSLNMQFNLVISQQQKPISLQFDCNFSEKNFILCNEEVLSIILKKLIDNAIKFSKSGNIIINSSQNNNQLKFTISDQGIGIPSNKFDEIFESFVQVDNELDRKYVGIGLGLSICKGLISLMGGNIYVESKINMGSTFSFSIPIQQPQELSIELYDKISNCLNNKIYQGIILVVSQDKEECAFLIDYFNQFKCRTICVSGMVQAEKTLLNFPDIAIAIIDIEYPTLAGCDIAAKLLNISPEIKFAFITPIKLKDNELDRASIFTTEFLIKPIVTSDILSSLNRLLILKKISIN